MQNIVANNIHYQHVAVAVILRNNYILISKRDKNVAQGDLWEFPGGKVEANESVLQALYRELDEELGIRVEQAHPLITIPYSYVNKFEKTEAINVVQESLSNVLLDVWIVTRFSGRALSKENQPIKWVSQKQLTTIDFPAANRHIISALSLPDTYVISPDIDVSDTIAKEKLIQDFRKLCQQGHSLMQLRFRKNSPDSFFIQELCQIAKNSQVKLQLNSSLIDLYSNEDTQLGIHLSSRDLYNKQTISSLTSKSTYYSASCHQLEDIIQANKLGIDFIVLSPIQKTNSHPQAQTLGWQQFKELTKHAQMPVYALGGMQIEDIEKAKLAGAQGIAAISAFWDN